MKLYSSVIKLTTLRPATLTHFSGQHAHAAFLDIVRAVDETLSAQLHDINARKPFTVSPIMGLPKEKQAGPKEGKNGTTGLYLREGWQCWLRVTMLDDVLFRVFLESFLNPGLDQAKQHHLPKQQRRRELPAIRIGDAEFLISEILTTPGSHPWAGYVSLDDLLKRLDEPASDKFRFELHTPTAFGWKDNLVATMPTPALVFGNLARAWDMFTGQKQAKVVENYATETLLYSNFNLRTEHMTLHNKTQLGAVGRFEFIRTTRQDDPLARALNLLADLAFFTGLGRKTTQGMGMASRL